jgi:putative heme-binding domain-containing protein
MKHRLPACLSAFLLTFAASAVAAGGPPKSEDDILKRVKLPPGFEATVFAVPPQGGYPTSVSAAVDGTLFVAIDQNGSLDRERNKPGNARGKVMRLRDTDGDGRADEFKTFAEMESPRGVIWDGPSGTSPGTLYVMHPPNLTAYIDSNGDGVADRQQDIVTGLGFDLSFRGADHTTNGCRLAIDGFIYIAMGDYGSVEAKGRDGTVIKNRGGGIVRVRPDGTGLELVARGLRNIYDVAVSPQLDLFTRDNTNDGGGWDVRLSFVPPGAHMGYPSYFKNFPEDMLQPLADYGGGSPCGALWLDEPGQQNGLYTVEWGRNGITFHGLKPKGAGWEVEGPNQGQSEWLKITRPTDIDVDAVGRFYVSSWEGATYNYAGPNAGYILRLVKKDAAPATAPDIAKMGAPQLAAAVASPSAVLRLAAQRELLRRGAKAAPIADLEKTAGTEGPLPARIAALETLQQLTGAAGIPRLFAFAKDAAIRESVVRAVGDDPRAAKSIPAQSLTPGLTDANPRIRSAAITALRRLGKTEAAGAILPLVADPDPIIAHLATRALSELKASQVCLGALDSADEKVKPGALRALYGISDPAVVAGLISRLPGAKGETRQGILNALCRLAQREAPYTDPKMWWNTRPDSSGPLYQPIAWSETEKISTTLKKALDAAPPEEAKWLVQRMYACKVSFPGLVELMLAKAGNDTAAKLTAVTGLFKPDDTLPPEGLAALQAIALNEKDTPDFRAKALRLLQRASETQFDAAFAAFAPLAAHDPGQPALTGAFEDFTRDSKNAKNLDAIAREAAGKDPARRTLAQTILVNLSTSTLLKGREKENAEHAVEKSWANPDAAASLLGVIARTKARGLADQVKAHLKDPHNAVAEAALYAYQSLGLTETGAPVQTIGAMKFEMVAALVAKGGDAAQGRDIFLRAGCIACHTVSSDEPPKGPILSAVVKIYDRAALTESILKPNAKIAQGFESAWFKTKKGEQIEGFVTREGGDSVDVRNIAAQTVTIERGDIVERGKRETSMMPEGLLAGFTPPDLANLLAYLESLKAK